MKEDGKLMNADGTPGVRLIYIDPPFSTRRDFKGTQEQKAYQDKIAGAEFLEFLRKRLILLRELLAKDGSIYVHLDWKKAHYVKVLMDEIFGEQNFRNEIIWHYFMGGKAVNFFARKHDVIYFYSKGGKYDFKIDETKRILPYKPSLSSHKILEQIKCESCRKDSGVYLSTVKMDDVWDISGVFNMSSEYIDYPSQKPEKLLERIIKVSSNRGDIVLDAFAGSGTAPAVAEKLTRRWIAIDIGKLSIYTIQKRMLNLRSEIGNKGEKLKPKPFTFYNSGLYDFENLRNLSFEDWRFFALQLFECKDEPHEIHGFKMDGKRQGASVFVFDHFKEGQINTDTIADLHASIGKAVGDRCFIIAPRGTFLFQEDYIEMDGVKYYALRIPYSFINELHRREFSTLAQPDNKDAINEIVDVVGFHFIKPPQVELQFSESKENIIPIKIKKFVSRVRLKEEEKDKYNALSMVMVDYDYDGKVFNLHECFYAKKIKGKIELSAKKVKGNVMLVFLDIYGNEARRIIERNKLISKK